MFRTISHKVYLLSVFFRYQILLVILAFATGVMVFAGEYRGIPKNVIERLNVVTGERTACAFLMGGNSLACWGRFFRKYDNFKEVTETLNRINWYKGIKKVKVNDGFICVLDNEGLWCNGYGSYGRFGFNPVDFDPKTLTEFEVTADSTCLSDANQTKCFGQSSKFEFPKTLTKVEKFTFGRNHVCALAQGDVYCSGLDVPEKVNADHNVIDVASGTNHACATTGKHTFCWGLDEYNPIVKPTAKRGVKFLKATSNATVAVYESGYDCWGECEKINIYLSKFKKIHQIEFTDNYSGCAFYDANVSCWNSPYAIEKPFIHSSDLKNLKVLSLGSIRSGDSFPLVCGINEDDLFCRGSKYVDTSVPKVLDGIRSMKVLGEGLCFLMDSDEVICQGIANADPFNDMIREYGIKNIDAWDLNYNSICVSSSKGIQCGGIDIANPPNASDFKKVSKIVVGTEYIYPGDQDHYRTVVAILEDDVASFWNGEVSVSLSGIATIDNFARCASNSREVFCWDKIERIERKTQGIHLGKVTDISSGRKFSCAVFNGEIVCWGENDKRQLDFPEGLKNVTKVVTSDAGACALANGKPFCWGDRTKNYSDLISKYDGIDEIGMGAGITCIRKGDDWKCFEESRNSTFGYHDYDLSELWSEH